MTPLIKGILLDEAHPYTRHEMPQSLHSWDVELSQHCKCIYKHIHLQTYKYAISTAKLMIIVKIKIIVQYCTCFHYQAIIITAHKYMWNVHLYIDKKLLRHQRNISGISKRTTISSQTKQLPLDFFVPLHDASTRVLWYHKNQ